MSFCKAIHVTVQLGYWLQMRDTQRTNKIYGAHDAQYECGNMKWQKIAYDIIRQAPFVYVLLKAGSIY